jgi:hypothetical protein
VQCEQDGEGLKDEVRQFQLVRHDLDKLWIDRVPLTPSPLLLKNVGLFSALEHL